MDCKHCACVEAARALGSMTAKQLSEATGLTHRSARIFAKRHGITLVSPVARQLALAQELVEPTAQELATALGLMVSGAYTFARKHGIALRSMPPVGVKPALITLLKERPNICAEMSLKDIGVELGVTGERIRQLMPEYSARRLAAVGTKSRVAAFVEAHPEVNIPTWMGGMSYTEAGKLLGVNAGVFNRTMLELGYKKSLIVQTPSETREMNKRGMVKWQAKVLRRETCGGCGREFDWTNRYEMLCKHGVVGCRKECTEKMRAG